MQYTYCETLFVLVTYKLIHSSLCVTVLVLYYTYCNHVINVITAYQLS